MQKHFAHCAFRAEQRTADLFVSRAAKPDQPDQFTPPYRQIDRPGTRRRQIADLQHRLAIISLRPLDIPGLAPDDQADKFVRIGVRDIADPHQRTITQDRGAIGDAEDLVQTVRDVDHADTLVAQGTQCAEQPLNLVGGQARGFGSSRTRKSHSTASARAIATRDFSVRVRSLTRVVGSNMQSTRASAKAAVSSAARQSIRPRLLANPCDNAMFSATVIQSIRPRSWWMNATACRASILPGVCEYAAPSISTRPAVRRIDAAKYLDKCRFPGAILTQQGNDLAPVDMK